MPIFGITSADPLPVLNNLYGLRYNRAMSSNGVELYNVYAADVSALLKTYGMKLAQGRLPHNNANELLAPQNFALQYHLKVGDAVGTEISDRYELPGRYIIAGLLEGPVMLGIACQPESLSRAQIGQMSLLYRVNGMSAETQKELTGLLPKSVTVLDYKTYADELYAQMWMMQVLTYIITAIMVVILCIALGNLTAITFALRREEFAVLNAVGYSKGRLVRKLWEENVLVCFLGYAAGVALTELVGWLLNQAFYLPKGDPLVLYDGQSLLTALLIPAFVSVFSLLPGILHNFSRHADFSV